MGKIKNIVTTLILISVCTTLSYAQLTWNKVLTTNQRVSIIYFIDKNIGFVANGTVPGGTAQSPKVYRTSDGGTTWNQVTLSGLGNFGIQDIYFENGLVGYAIGASGLSTLWKSTDGGLTWSARTGAGLSVPFTIRRTAAGLVASDFYKQLMVSTDDGQTFSKRTTTTEDETHLGMDFVDSLHGVVDGNYRSSTTSWYYTEDGGKTWKPNGTRMETWSMFGQKGTPNFFACPEGYSTGSSAFSDVYRSTDYGKSFSTVHRFPFQMIGDVQGAGNTLYTQSAQAGSATKGVYRSTDLGVSWTLQGGYNAIADTRFAVIPDCGGNIIFIADQSGSIYRAADNIGTGGGGGTKKVYCTADFRSTASVSPGARVTIPIGIQVGNEPDVIGATPREIEYVIEFSTLVIDTMKFSMASDITPPAGWTVTNAVMRGDSLKVILENTAINAITKSQGFGSVVLTTLSGTPNEFCEVVLRRVTLSNDCSPITIVPTIEQSTLTRIAITPTSVSRTEEEDRLVLYPNPASKNITLRSGLLTSGNSSITIFDIRGITVMNEILPEGSSEYQLSLHQLVPGTYTLRFDHSESAPIFKRFVIE